MLAVLVGLALLQACGSSPDSDGTDDEARLAALSVTPGYKVGRPYEILGERYHPKEMFQWEEEGIASWYGPGFHGRLTANGERYDMRAYTAAHRTLQLPSIVRVTNLETGKSTIVRVNDRGPFHDNRVIDLSERVAETLGFRDKGIARVRVTLLPSESRKVARMAKARATVGEMDSIVAALNADPPDSPAALVANSNGSLDPLRGPGWFLQAAAFRNPSNADNARSRLRNVGPTRVVPRQKGRQTLYLVRLGPYGSKDQALEALGRIREVGFDSALLLAES